ncbi:hypothetical protein CXB51_019676 [Gossypium anomalum]|uniref:Aspartic peptidase DDI1-type domain-containing protein n=1 Tax=Gossypium anomalum TaxID=47600 RepID=A0A8J6CVN5_9ROSI|nr:hypothetical protein CXB51_019676 [Gossypium anomalum]
MFYNGVNPSTRQMIDAAAGGTINNKTPEEAYEFIEEMSLNNYQCKSRGLNQLKQQAFITSIPLLCCQISNTYNAGWRNHPNFSWGGQWNQRPQNPPSFQQPPYQQEKKLNLEEMLSKFISNTETALKNQQASIQGLETQIGQLSKLIFERPQGSLSSNTEPNLREQFNAINVQGEEGSVEPELEPRQETVVSKSKGEMPNTMKFLKELLANKRKLDEASHVELNAVCSAIRQNKLPNKLKDPGSFTISCLIGSLDVNNALADLGANKAIKFPRGIIEDVLVKINKFIFLVDFVVLDIEEDSITPLILGRPFLATVRTIIDVGTGELTLRVRDETITLQARISGNTSKIKGDCINHSTKTDNLVQPTLQEMSSKEVHEPCSSNNIGSIHEERRLQIEELEEWRTHKPRTHDKPKLR